MDRFPYRDVPTTHIHGLQTPYTFHPWIISFQSQYRWQQVTAAVSHFDNWRWEQDHYKSKDERWKCVQQVVETTRQVQEFGVTIHEIEEVMDICDNKPFDQSEESFAKLEELLKVSLSVFEITLLPGYDDNSKDKYDLFTNSQIYTPDGSGGSVSLCTVNDTHCEEVFPKHFLYIKDLSNFKHRIFR